MALPTRRSTSTSNPPERWDPFREFDDLQTRMERLASLDDGVLTLRLPKPAADRPREIQVNSGASR
jgi:hypothetical protein